MTRGRPWGRRRERSDRWAWTAVRIRVTSLHPGPAQTFATFRVDHREALRQFFALAHDKPMLRMMVTADSFAVPTEEGEEAADGSELRRLSDRDIPEVDDMLPSEVRLEKLRHCRPR